MVSQGSVATRLRCGGISVLSRLLSMEMKTVAGYWRMRRIEAESGAGVLGKGQQPTWGSAVRSPSRSPKGLPLFSALRMSSPDTNIVMPPPLGREH